MRYFIIRIITLIVFTVTFLTSCGKKEKTLQGYIVEKQEEPGFYNQTVPKGLLGIDQRTLSSDDKIAYESVDKISVLFYPLKTDSDRAIYKMENENLAKILENEAYKPLMTHKSDKMRVQFLYTGETDAIDEMILYGSSDEMGLGVARILGNNMKPAQIIKMLQNMDTSNMKFDFLKEMIRSKGMETDSLEVNKEI